jgi:electron transfer flavoprotein beta subunit
MKILVPIKRVLDHNVPARLTPRGTVQTDGCNHEINPFDAVALEAAVRIRERGLAREVVAVSVGTDEFVSSLRTALAVGADRGILVRTEAPLEPLAVAKIFHRLCLAEMPDLVIAGKQAIDDDAAQVGPMLAMLLGWAQATNVSHLEWVDGQIDAMCEVDRGTRRLRLSLPAVVTVDLRLNEPRYASLPNVMRAKKKPLEIKSLTDFGIDVSPKTEQIALREIDICRRATLVPDVDAFAAALLATGSLR